MLQCLDRPGRDGFSPTAGYYEWLDNSHSFSLHARANQGLGFSIGCTGAEIRRSSCWDRWGNRGSEKSTYSIVGEFDVMSTLGQLDRRQLVLAGGETDVCVLQSVLDLIDQRFSVFVIADAIYSSAADVTAASHRMQQAGATMISYKSLFYELIRSEASDAWSRLDALAGTGGFIPPEMLEQGST